MSVTLTFDPDYKYYYAPDGFPAQWHMMPSRLSLPHNGDSTFEDVTARMGIVDIDGRAMVLVLPIMTLTDGSTSMLPTIIP